MTTLRVNNRVSSILTELHTHGITSYFVGGCVRDHLLGVESDDIDFCLTGVTDTQLLEEILRFHSDAVAADVGNTFPVWIATIDGETYDFAMARVERLEGHTRRDFFVGTENVTIEDDLMRRDLTINAIAINCLTGAIVDPFEGVSDLRKGVAREVSQAFAEDSLRVLRAARFISRFNLNPSQSLIDMCRGLNPSDISRERVGMELYKMTYQAQTPSLFFRFLLEVGWLGYHFQPVLDLVGLEQSTVWHPEGDVFEHTMHCMDAANDPFTRVVMLCHDLGKVSTTQVQEDGSITARGHAGAGVPIAREMLSNISFRNGDLIDQVCTLVDLHMIHTSPPQSRSSVARVIRRLQAVGLEYGDLVEVCRCDVSGRPPMEGYTPDIGQAIAEHLVIETERGEGMNPIVNGNMLIDAGVPQGPEIGRLKRELFDLQMDGVLTENNWRGFIS